MGKLNCPCGEQLSDVQSPNEVVGYLISDMDLEECDDINSVNVVPISRTVWECDKCGRLAFNWPSKKTNAVKWYSPDNNEAGHLMAQIPHESNTDNPVDFPKG